MRKKEKRRKKEVDFILPTCQQFKFMNFYIALLSIGTYRYSTDTVIGTRQILVGTISVLIGTLSVITSITDTGTVGN